MKSTLSKLLLFVILLFLFRPAVNCQVIKGAVLDIETRKPVSFAYLYFSGTFTGTQSDQNGYFELDVSKNASQQLIISAVGYYSAALSDFSDKYHLVYLSPKLYELNEVNISSKSLARKRKANLFIFKNEFLGATANARDCIILNENDISFNYDTDRDTLKAFASKPILIDNRALGYKITYYLDQFAYDRRSKTFYFKGNIVFTEDLINDVTQEQLFERKRKQAYTGSRMQFFRALWYEDLKSAKFSVHDAAGKTLGYKEIIVTDANNKKYLKYDGDLTILYYSNAESTIKFLNDSIFFEKDGYFDPFAVILSGQMAVYRIADWLPYEYGPQE